jgi:hypothetical protein
MIRIELTHSFPTPVATGFEYITDTRNWHEYWPGFVRLENQDDVSWQAPGDRATIVVKLLGRETRLDLTLEEFERDALVRYVSRQERLPEAHHERRFTPTGTGFDYTIGVSIEPRKGLAGLFDRLVLKRAIASALRQTITNLEAPLHARRSEQAL